MLMLGTVPLAGHLKTKLFTTSGSFVVPADVSVIWIDGSGGGGGGGGGDPTPGGGGGGGSAGVAFAAMLWPVIPSEILTITVGSGGAGGSAGNNGGAGGTTYILTTAGNIVCALGSPGNKGANPNGGSGGGLYTSSIAGPSGGAGAGVAAVCYGAGSYGYAYQGNNPLFTCRTTTGAAGGALTFSGGTAYRQDMAINFGATSIAVATGDSSGGGGGAGGCGFFGFGGAGGSNGAAGSNGTGYGSGGGGGSGNSAGGNGAAGFVRLYLVTGYAI